MKHANANEYDFPPKDFFVDSQSLDFKDISRFISLIRKNTTEQEISAFLKKRLSILSLSSDFFRTGHHGLWIIPQAHIRPHSFTEEHGLIPDYLFAGDNSDGITWWVVELKSPGDSLYKKNKSGRRVETNALRDGLAQLRDYVSFCERHQGHIREVLNLKSFTSPYGVIIIGREKELHEDLRKQKAKSIFNKKNVALQIRTYDSFLRKIMSYSKAADQLPFLSKLYCRFFIRKEIVHSD